jgi:hypothetical protein
MEYVYDIKQFIWSSEKNTFYADAPYLTCELPDGKYHPEAFPNGKSQFTIKNYLTGNFRRFRFVSQYLEYYDYGENEQFDSLVWVFESEDNIKCEITVTL